MLRMSLVGTIAIRSVLFASSAVAASAQDPQEPDPAEQVQPAEEPEQDQQQPPPPLYGPLLPENYIDMRAGSVVIEPRRSEDPLPVAGYDKSPVNGAFVQSEDGQFRLQVGGYTQIRWSGNIRTAPERSDPPTDDDLEFGNDDFTRGWSMRRTRLFLEGKYTDDFSFHLRTNTNDSFDTELLVAWGQWRIDDSWAIRFGKHFIPLSREDWMFAQDILTIEFSPNDYTYAIGTSLGAFAHYQGDATRFWIGLHNGAYGGRDTFPAPETDIATTARWEWNIVGDDWAVWDDQVGRPGRATVTMLGLSGGYQTAVQGSDPSVNRTERAAQANADLSFNGDGYQHMLAASATWVDPESTPSYLNYGFLAQAGFFVSDVSQFYGQYNLVSPGDQPGDLETFHSLAVGYSFLPFTWTNRWKFSAEFGHLFGVLNETIVDPSGSLGWLPADEDDQSYIKLQAQFGF